MQALKINATNETPAIIFDKKSNVFSVIGRSMPENAAKFYNSVLDWVEAYTLNPNLQTQLDINLEYFNTASSKLILDALVLFGSITKMPNHSLIVNWHYDKDDEDLYESGVGFSSLVNLPFNMVSY